MWAMIGTWMMSLDGITGASARLAQGGGSADAVEQAVRAVEDVPYFKSVGYGGLPNEEMEVECDAAFMDGDTLEFGAVGALQNVGNPVSVARSLAGGDANNLLVGAGAGKYAEKAGFERRNMLTKRSRAYYAKRLAEEGGYVPGTVRKLGEPEAEQEAERGAACGQAAEAAAACGLHAGASDSGRPADSPASDRTAADIAEDGTNPGGHDTVGMVALDASGSMAAATSTSGLFMKLPGRVGDSPVPGAGYYVDSAVGGCASTGLGEDVMKGCVGYEIVRLMEEGLHPQAACEQAIHRFDAKLRERRGHAGDISFVALDARGRWGAASNIEGFSFVVQTEDEGPQVYLCHPREDGTCEHEVASEDWRREYIESRKKPVVF